MKEWAHGDHITLDKNWQFWAEDQVQIERINGRMYSQATAWSEYLASDLDTVPVPSGTTIAPDLRAEIHAQPGACNYYYGFSLSQAPFDKLLVRKAFAAATNRKGLVDAAFGGTQRPAITFTPYGVFGYVDGAAEGVGIPYDQGLAQAWLAAAGYPGGAGLPQITLWYNTSATHKAIAEFVRESWHDTLGVSVTLASLAWDVYLPETQKGYMQIWRMGWCMDYPERTYPVGGQPDVAGWRIRTFKTIEPAAGGTLTSYQGDTTIQIPPNALQATTMITISSISRQRVAGRLTGIGHLFDVTAVVTPTGEPAVLAPGQTYDLTVHYTEQERGAVKEDTLALYSWNGADWVKDPSSAVDADGNIVSTAPDHFSLWVAVGETEHTYLPVGLR